MKKLKRKKLQELSDDLFEKKDLLTPLQLSVAIGGKIKSKDSTYVCINGDMAIDHDVYDDPNLGHPHYVCW